MAGKGAELEIKLLERSEIIYLRRSSGILS